MKIVTGIIFILFFNLLSVKAQLCTGSLGDPILNETFGTDNFRLPSYKTTYNFVGGCPTKGNYTINDFLFGCGNHTWVQMIGDHTPNDLNGNYMLVNAESTPGTVYIDTVKGLCGNTVYQFGMWATSVMSKFACGGNALLPNIKYEIKTLSGVSLALDSTGYLPLVDEREWKYYGLSIKTPVIAGDVIVSITVNPLFGCGSGFAIDDITLNPCGPTISATIDGIPGPKNVCADYTDPFIMNATYSPVFIDPVLQWQSSTDTGKAWVDIPGETTFTYQVPHRTSGVILYRVSTAERANIGSLQCRINSNIIYTDIHPVPEHKAPQNLSGCLEKDFFLPLTDPTALNILWTGPKGYSSNATASIIPKIQYSDTGLYKLKETFYFGCVSLDTFYLKVSPSTTISVTPSYPICEGSNEQLFASASDSVGYKWTPSVGLSNAGIPNPIASPTDSIVYKVIITNKYGCKDSAYLPIDVYRKPTANAGPDKVILIGDTANLNASVKGTSVNFFWTPSAFINNVNVINPIVSPPQSTAYTLHVVSTVGCGLASDNVLVKVYKDFYIPNAFTPNNDGKNDKFEIPALDNYKLISLIIYNRWGQVVFKSKGAFAAWDGYRNGIIQIQGIYVYYVEIQAPNGRKITRKGSIMLLR